MTPQTPQTPNKDAATSSLQKDTNIHFDDHALLDYQAVHSPIKPTAPPAEWASSVSPKRDDGVDPQVPYASPAPAPPLPPSARAKRGLAWLTLKLVPYHVLNFALGTAAFCVVVTGLSLAGGLLPLCCLGVPLYFLLLQCTRAFVAMDIALANRITRPQARARWRAPDDADAESDAGATAVGYDALRIAPKLTRPSWRSTAALVYFATLKFALGIASCVVVTLPFLPLAAEIVSHTADTEDTYVAGWNVHKFNFGTHPVLFAVVFVAYVVVGVALMHVLGIVSREATRRVCCVESVPLEAGGARQASV